MNSLSSVIRNDTTRRRIPSIAAVVIFIVAAIFWRTAAFRGQQQKIKIVSSSSSISSSRGSSGSSGSSSSSSSSSSSNGACFSDSASVPVSAEFRGELVSSTHISNNKNNNNNDEILTYIRSFACPSTYFGSRPSEVWVCSSSSSSSSSTSSSSSSSTEPIWTKIQGSGCGRPAMTQKDVALLASTYGGAKHIFEWGTGGSSRVAASIPTLRSLVSIESDPEWASLVNMTGLLPGIDTELHLIDIQALPKTWGHPGPGATEEAKRSYSAQLLQHPRSDFDIVLVDGRFRVACALSFLLKKPNIPTASKLVFHDFLDRDIYHVILPFFQKIASGDTAVVLQARQDLSEADMKQVKELYEKYRLTAM